jgi:hypothetical protein
MNTADNLFLQNACQYYATARFAVHAECMPVCGNLFHHAVEMFLKAGLAQRRELSELRNMSHKLKEKLWPAFKQDFANPGLTRHDKTIACLDEFEDIRYPDEVLKRGMGVTADWSSGSAVILAGKASTPQQYKIVVSDIDDLIADVFKVCSRNPPAFTNSAAREAINRHNAHSKFLLG